MAYKLITSPETENDIVKAIEYYLDIRKELAQQFLIELKAAKELQAQKDKAAMEREKLKARTAIRNKVSGEGKNK